MLRFQSSASCRPSAAKLSISPQHYEIRREFAPYIGVNWPQKFGQTAYYARDEGEDSSDTRFVAGIRAWF